MADNGNTFLSRVSSIVLLFWGTMSMIGTQKIENDRLRRKITICNQLAFTVGVLPIFTSLYLLFIVKSPIFFTPLIVGSLYMITIVFNRFSLHTFSRIYLTILPTINLMIVSGFLSDKYSISMKIPYISIIVGPIILFDLSEKRKLWFGILWVVFMFFMTDVINPYIPVFPNLDPLMINNLLMINFTSVLSFIIFISGFLYLQQINNNAEQRLTQLYNETEQQKLELEYKNKTITDSINYARSIQNAVLPKHQILKPYCNEYFLYYKPKDIVSGDFYMFNTVNDQLIIAVADCTGHGIPGALMSMLGMSFFSETLLKHGLKKPNELLDDLRHQIKSALKQQDFSTKSKDGMDMAVVIIDTITLRAEYAGANRPLIIIKGSDKNNYIELKPDNSPVGIHTREINFHSIDFQIEKGDSLYMFSDGYEDQFGGKDCTKMKSKTFRQLLVDMQNKNMKSQRETLEQYHNEWRADEPQTDDILIVGIRF